MSQFGAPSSYNVAVASSDIPSAWLPDSRPRVASGGSKRIISIASQNGTVTSGQPLQFQLPAGMGSGFLMSGSAYIRMAITVTIAGGTYAFKQTGAASSVVQRMTATLSGSQVETIQNYGKLYNSLIQHACNANYVANDNKLSEETYPAAFRATGTEIVVCIPVGLGLFNAKQHLPLFLLSSAMLQVDLASVADAITSVTALATQFSVANAVLIAEQIVPDSQYEMGMKQMLASRVYQMAFDTFYNTKYAGQAAITANLGLNSSSVRSVLWTAIPWTGDYRPHSQTSGGQSQCYLTLDGALVSNSQLNNVSEQYLEMNRSLNNIFDITRTSVGPNRVAADQVAAADDVTLAPISRTTYASGAYLGGLSCQRSNDSGFGFVGTPVNQAVLSWSGIALTAGEFHVFVALQQVLTVDQNGTCNLIR
jgi:hypothetical protein